MSGFSSEAFLRKLYFISSSIKAEVHTEKLEWFDEAIQRAGIKDVEFGEHDIIILPESKLPVAAQLDLMSCWQLTENNKIKAHHVFHTMFPVTTNPDWIGRIIENFAYDFERLKCEK